jgi:hypothetical protein
VSGKFLDYWTNHGGLAQQGYPISQEMQEVSDIDGRTYTVQYFERAVFELHPENQPPYDVLLSLLGTIRYQGKYPNGAPSEKPNESSGSVFFPQTGKRLGGSFLLYWKQYGGLMQQGYPISDEVQEKSDLDGNTYTVQYFERSVMEWHPGNTPPYDVLLSQLGTFRYREKYGPNPTSTQSPVSPVPPTPSVTTIPTMGLPLSTKVVGDPVLADPYLCWVDSQPKTGHETVMGYDSQQQQTFVITTTTSTVLSLASDGHTLVWADTPASSGPTIYGYDLAERRFVLQIPFPTGAEIGGMAVTTSTLYYVGPHGLVARDRTTGSERTVLTDGVDPVVSADGNTLLWSEEHYVGRFAPNIWTLYVRQRNDPSTDRILAQQQGSLSAYGVWGHYVTWSFDDAAIDNRAYLADLTTGQIQAISEGQAEEPKIGPTAVIWATPPGPSQTGWTLTRYQLADGTQEVVVSNTALHLTPVGVFSSGAIAYTALDLTDPYGKQVLYVQSP